MLILARRANQSIVINGELTLTVLEVGRNGQVRLGISAPRHYQIYRQELYDEIMRENRTALTSDATFASLSADAEQLGALLAAARAAPPLVSPAASATSVPAASSPH